MISQSLKLSDISQEHFTIFAYCPSCSIYHLIDNRKYANYTFEEMSCKVNCPECGSLGLVCSVIPNDEDNQPGW